MHPGELPAKTVGIGETEAVGDAVESLTVAVEFRHKVDAALAEVYFHGVNHSIARLCRSTHHSNEIYYKYL